MITEKQNTPESTAAGGVGSDAGLGGLVRALAPGMCIEGVEVWERGVVLTLRRRSGLMYACNPPRPCPDEVWRETYELTDGKLRKTKHENGTHVPAQQLPETFVFA